MPILASLPAPKAVQPEPAAPETKSTGKHSPTPVPPVHVDRAAVTSTAKLHLITRPWAQVSVDGVDRGKTPVLRELSLPAGEHKIRLFNPQAKLVEFSVQLRPGEVLERREVLPILPGLVQVLPAPGDQVWVDGRPASPKEFAEPIELPYGPHVISFAHDGEIRKVAIKVLAGRQVTARSPFLQQGSLVPVAGSSAP
jgi:serine/threonine-protein kinase